jgi:tRNA A-37 threonylcarbamoyl transferase component Bud32
VDRRYEAYCLVDPVFYDSPSVARGDDVDFPQACVPAPPGWKRAELDDWVMLGPRGVELPPQGWKIHASACTDNAAEVLDAVWSYCVPRRIAFKFIRSPQLVFFRNVKYASRASSGKFATIYPRDEAELERVLTELGELLAGQPGPYILSDLRWGEGPLYVRYGGFADRWCLGSAGELEPAIANADGELVPDRREATFVLPPWVALPSCLEPQLAARNSATVQDIPYEIESALHFSNGGGVYLGTDQRTGGRVVLKEARPHAGLAMDGADAVARLGHERRILERLHGLDLVPEVRDDLVLGEHHFLVMDYVPGSDLGSLLVERYPLTLDDPDDDALATFTNWALDVSAQLELAVAAVHGRGIAIGDLHPSNVLVRPDGRVALIDLEVAADIEAQRRPTLADPGFLAPADRRGAELDLYALAALRLFMFLPLTTLLSRDREKAWELASAIEDMFPVPAGFVREAAQVITGRELPSGEARPRLAPDAAQWPQARSSMARAIGLSATPEREDRLFPGDIKQFDTSEVSLAYGAAGVLYALDAVGAERRPEHEEWLVRRATNPRPGARFGFWDGLHGAAYALDQLGRCDDAARVLDICLSELDGHWEGMGIDLYTGLAGIGLNLVHFAERTGERSLLAHALRIADVTADRLEAEPIEEGAVSGGEHRHAGLLRGWSGAALLFLRLYEQLEDRVLLDLAATALRHDLARCIVREDGVMEVNEGWRTMPYLADGSVGIGFVLDDYLAHAEDERFADASAAIRLAARSKFYIEPGLFWGRAGMILYLARACEPGQAWRDPVIARHIRHLNWHALAYRGELAFPGEQLLRLSMDMATGTAGVVFALGAAFHSRPCGLPFLRLACKREPPKVQLQAIGERR